MTTVLASRSSLSGLDKSFDNAHVRLVRFRHRNPLGRESLILAGYQLVLRVVALSVSMAATSKLAMRAQFVFLLLTTARCRLAP